MNTFFRKLFVKPFFSVIFFCFYLLLLVDAFAQTYTCSKQDNISSMVYQYCPIIDSQEKIEGIGIEYKNDTIIYRIIWSDETYPNSFVNYIYKLYRKIKYGSEKDIEYVAIKIEDTSSCVVEFEYPTTYKLFFIDISGHKKIRKTINSNKCKKIKLKVITWNHLFSPSIECSNSFIDSGSIIEVPTFYVGKDFKMEYKLKNRSNPSF